MAEKGVDDNDDDVYADAEVEEDTTIIWHEWVFRHKHEKVLAPNHSRITHPHYDCFQ